MRGGFLLLLLSVSLHGSSLRMYNDSPYPLRAVIQGADGSTMGEVTIQPNVLMVWNSANGFMGYHEPTRSESPFTVLWHCMQGEPYSICNLVANAAMVTAQTCRGNRQCKTPPPKPPSDAQGQQQPQVEFAPPAFEPTAPPQTLPNQEGFSESTTP